MTRKFHNRKSILWLLGMALLIGGFLVFALVVPPNSGPHNTGPEVNVPSMQNIPPPSAPNMQWETQ